MRPPYAWEAGYAEYQAREAEATARLRAGAVPVPVAIPPRIEDNEYVETRQRVSNMEASLYASNGGNARAAERVARDCAKRRDVRLGL